MDETQVVEREAEQTPAEPAEDVRYSSLLDDFEEPGAYGDYEPAEDEEAEEPHAGDAEPPHPGEAHTDEGAEQEPEQDAYQPAAPTLAIAGMTAEQEEQVNQLYVTNPAAAMRMVVQHEMRQAQQAQAVGDYHYHALEAQAPDLFRVHGPRIRQHLASLPAEHRANKEAVMGAALAAIFDEARATGDLSGALRRAAQLTGGQQAAQLTGGQQAAQLTGGQQPTQAAAGAQQGAQRAAAAPQKPAQPVAAPQRPGQRVPSPGVAGAAARGGTVRPRPTQGRDLVAERMAASFNLGKGTASRIAEEVG